MQLDQFISQIQSHYNSQKAFVVYKKPSEKKITGLVPANIRFGDENLDKQGFLFAPFTRLNHPKVFFEKEKSILLEAVISDDFDSKETNFFFQPNLTSKDFHLQIVNKSLESLKSGALQKVVISRKETLPVNEFNPLKSFLKACKLYPNAFCYCWYHPDVGLWIGATPETLLKLEKNNFETMALAGTLPYDISENVNWGNKEIEEQQIVVDSIITELSPITKKIEKGTTVTHRAGTLLHLKTPIWGTLQSAKSLPQLIALLHPTSAVCGLPKAIAKQFILDNEGYDRKYYTGYLGEINPAGTSNLFVNLRCLEYVNKSVNVYVGGGITASSVAEKEWQETVNKSQIMKQIL